VQQDVWYADYTSEWIRETLFAAAELALPVSAARRQAGMHSDKAQAQILFALPAQNFKAGIFFGAFTSVEMLISRHFSASAVRAASASPA
jgi:hypothetical protein